MRSADRIFSLESFAAVLLLGLYLFQGWLIYHYSVDLPLGDSWSLLEPGALSREFSLRWLWTQHNEHRIVFTKLQSWLFLLFDGWNQRHEVLWNYLIYGAYIASFEWVRRIAAPTLSRGFFWLLLVFLTSPIIHENHWWSFQSQFHYFLLFLNLGFCFFLSPTPTRCKNVAASFFLLASVYSFSSGLVAVFSGVLAYVFFSYDFEAAFKNNLSKVSPVIWITLGGIILWFFSYTKIAGHPLTLPYRSWFWKFFANLVSGGFGIGTESFFFGVLALLFVIFPIAAVIWKKWGSADLESGKTKLSSPLPLILVFSLLGALASIAVGRAFFQAGTKTSRYLEIALPLVPLTYLMWWNFLPRSELRKFFSILYLGALFLFFSDDWYFSGYYRSQNIKVLQGQSCLKEQIKSRGIADCPDLYPAPLENQVKRAQELGASFTKELF